MLIERVMEHPVDPAQVFAMSCLPAFQERKCREAGALSWHVDVTTEGDSTTVRTRRKLPTVGFPSVLRKIVPAGVTSTESITWGPADATGRRVATLHVDLHGAPARMNGTITLSPTAAGSRVVVHAEFKALVPLIGGKVEKLAAPIILGVIESEERTGEAWIAEGR